MKRPLLSEWDRVATPIVGMLHAPPLPGAPRYDGDFSAVRGAILRDAETLVAGGVDGLMLENFGDAPFYPAAVPAETIAHLTALAADVRLMFKVPLGINVLRNDGRSALAIACAVGASFIRVNILCGARVADQGLIQGIAHDLLRDRARLGANGVRIFADVDVKHSAPLGLSSLSDDVHDLIERGGADAVIVSGAATGRDIDLDQFRIVRKAAGDTPVFLGSGVSIDSAARYIPAADGLIVGTSLKTDGRTNLPVDPERVRRLVDHVRQLAPPASS